MHLNRFIGAGGHVRFLNFEALFDIFELGIQQIWIQHPLSLEMLYTKFSESIFENSPKTACLH